MPDDQFDRVPPQDIDAEMSVLGSMMLTSEAANAVSEMLRGEDFYQPRHETIFDTIIELNGRAEPADAITVAGELEARGRPVQSGWRRLPAQPHRLRAHRRQRHLLCAHRARARHHASSRRRGHTRRSARLRGRRRRRSTRSSTRPKPRSTPSPTGAKPATTCPWTR